LREECQSFGLDLEDFLALERRGAHALAGEKPVLGAVGFERERILVDERRRGHGVTEKTITSRAAETSRCAELR
jgi:hypothetical protein